MRYLADKDFDRLKQTHPEIASGVCPTCQDTGTFKWWGDENVCDCITQRRLNRLYSHAGIEMKYQRLDWDDFILTPDQLAPIRSYIDGVDGHMNHGTGFFISGTVGTGKTFIATMILKALILKDYTCFFQMFSQTIESYTDSWGDSEKKEAFAERFLRSKVLCLDDLGREMPNKVAPAALDYILRTRNQCLRPSIVTTNLTPQQIQSRYGAQILSLLMEQSIGVHLTGLDFRPRAHERGENEKRQGELRPIT